MITRADFVVIPAGITAPAWVAGTTTWLGLMIAILTLVYTVFKVIDAYYHWRQRWAFRKQEAK